MIAFLVSIFVGFAPALMMAGFIYWLDRYEKEPVALLGGTFIWGAVLAAGGAYVVNTIFGVGIYALSGSEGLADQTTATVVAPFVEEALKGLAVLIVFLFFHNEFDSVLDGIIYAGITALGFAATENVMYIYERGYLVAGWNGLWQMAVIRDVVVAWQHPFFTAFTGIGLALARMTKQWALKLFAVVGGYAVAVFTHALHNALGSAIGGFEGFAIGSLTDWSGWLAMLVFILFVIGRERQMLQRQLLDEVGSGVISAAQYRRALSPFTMSTAAFHGGRPTARFYQVCGELAHKKEQLARLGEEDGNSAVVQSLRTELAALSPRVS